MTQLVELWPETGVYFSLFQWCSNQCVKEMDVKFTRVHCVMFAPCNTSLISPLQEQRLRYLKQQEQRQQQQASEQEKLQRLRENIENQEVRLKKVRALKGQVEQKRVSNGKLGELRDFFLCVCF